MLSVGYSVETSVGSNQQWTSSTENTNEQSRETTNEQNDQNTESLTNTNAYESSYESTETATIECAAEMEVVKYSSFMISHIEIHMYES